jgi:signal transduction histidine kinase
MVGVWRLMTRRFLAKPSPADWLLAAAVTLAAELEALLRPGQPLLDQRINVFAALALLGLAWWRRQPLVPVLLITGSGVASVVAGASTPTVVPQLALFLATFSLGAYAGNRQLGIGVVLPPMMAVAIDLLLPNPPVPLLGGLVWYVIFVTGVPVFIGRLVHGRSRLVDRLERQRTTLMAERDAGARQAVSAERQRVSHQLRGVVIYSVDALIADVRIAEADRGELGLAAVVRIESVARKALGDMRPLLVALRVQDAETPPTGNESTSAPAEVTAKPGPARRLVAALGRAPWPAVLATLVFVAVETRVQGLVPSNRPQLLVDAGLIGIAAPIAWSRARPLGAAVVSVLALAATSLFVVPIPTAGLPSAVLALYLPFSVAAVNDGRKALVGLFVCAAGFIGAYGFDAPPALVFGAGAWVAGRLLGDRTRLAGDLQTINRNLSEERGMRARELVLEERLRVARDLHDVIGHTLTVVVLQAGAARRNWAASPARATVALSSLASVAREGLTELLGSLDAVDESAHAMPGGLILRDVEALVEQARSAGVRVAFVPESFPSVVDQRLELTAYRIVQEALTNVMKHAPKSRAQVRIRSTTGSLHVEVLNSGPFRDRRSHGHQVGQGLPGMAQRVEANGGELNWGRDSTGGFAVRARLPIEEMA